MPSKVEPRQPHDALRELQQLLAGRNAHAAHPDIHLGQHADGDLRRAGGIGKLPRGEQAVERYGDARFAGHFHQPVQLGVPDHRVGHQQVRGLRAQHHLGLADLGHGQAHRA